MRDIVRGLVSGLVGTAAMSAVMAASRLRGTMPGETPPRQVARKAEETAGVRQALSRPAFEASWIAQHFAYGAATGAAYTVGWRRLGLRAPVPDGPLYGVALWAASYAGWLPIVGFHPPPHQEPGRRVASLVLQHVVYGTVTAAVARALPAAGVRPVPGQVPRRDGRLIARA